MIDKFLKLGIGCLIWITVFLLCIFIIAGFVCLLKDAHIISYYII